MNCFCITNAYDCWPLKVRIAKLRVSGDPGIINVQIDREKVFTMSKCISWRNSLAVALGCFAFGSDVMADWTSFRNGGASQVDSVLPTAWSASQGIAWQKELIGYGQSTPVIQGDKVFLSAVEGPMKEKGVVQCLDLKTGKELWTYTFETSNQAVSNYAASRAAASTWKKSWKVSRSFCGEPRR